MVGLPFPGHGTHQHLEGKELPDLQAAALVSQPKVHPLIAPSLLFVNSDSCAKVPTGEKPPRFDAKIPTSSTRYFYPSTNVASHTLVFAMSQATIVARDSAMYWLQFLCITFNVAGSRSVQSDGFGAGSRLTRCFQPYNPAAELNRPISTSTMAELGVGYWQESQKLQEGPYCVHPDGVACMHGVFTTSPLSRESGPPRDPIEPKGHLHFVLHIMEVGLHDQYHYMVLTCQ